MVDPAQEHRSQLRTAGCNRLRMTGVVGVDVVEDHRGIHEVVEGGTDHLEEGKGQRDAVVDNEDGSHSLEEASGGHPSGVHRAPCQDRTLHQHLEVDKVFHPIPLEDIPSDTLHTHQGVVAVLSGLDPILPEVARLHHA